VRGAVVHQWDPDVDRTELLDYFKKILTQGNRADDNDTLGEIQDKIKTARGDVLGWFVVSLLLTGDHKLCKAASDLLQRHNVREDIDVDLKPFDLTSPWILFLTRKILGYCLLQKKDAATLLLSCLRLVPEHDRAKLEDLVFDHFLLNYWNAICLFEAATSRHDEARHSVRHLASRIRAHIAESERSGICVAFKPSERERQIQAHHVQDFWREAYKKADEQSIVSVLARKATLLYGTASVVHLDVGGPGSPARQEMKLSAFRHSVELPRMYVLDPVGLECRIRAFEVEEPPE